MSVASDRSKSPSRAVHWISVTVLVVALLAIGIALLACTAAAIYAIYRSANRGDQRIVAADGSCQTMLPAGWVQVQPQGQSILAADGLSGRGMFDIYRVAKADLAPNMTNREHARRYVQNILNNQTYQNPRITKGPVDCDVGGRPAILYEIEGVFTQQQTRFIFLIRVIDGERSLLTAVASLPPSELQRHRQPAEKLLESVKELP